MTRYNSATITPAVMSATLGLPLAFISGIGSSALAGSTPAVPVQTLPGGSLVSLQFQLPEDVKLRDITGGATRGRVRFQPPGDAAPSNTTGGAVRGNVNFLPPGDAAPSNTTGGAVRGDVDFLPPGDAAPSNATGGAVRGDVDFLPPGEAAPRHTAGGAVRGDVDFLPPGEAAPRHTVGAASRDARLMELIPLMPENNHGRTVSSHPTIYVYVPRTATREVFFSLQDEQRNQHYQTTLKISGNGGIVSVTLPEDVPELEIGKNYVWFFAPIKPGDILRPDNYGVIGWVRRVEPLTTIRETSSSTPVEIATAYAGQGIWYDTLNVLVSAKRAQPRNATLATEWQDLLENVGLEEIATQPISEQL